MKKCCLVTKVDLFAKKAETNAKFNIMTTGIIR